MPKMAWARFSHQLSKILKKHMPAALKVDWFLSVRKSHTLCRQLAWLSVMTFLVVSLGHFLVACHSSHACNLNAGTSLEESTRISFCATSALCCCALGWSCTGCWSGGVVVDVGNKLGGCSSFNNHVCSGTVSQVTPLASHQHANTSCTKVGFELATDCIQFYVFAKQDKAAASEVVTVPALERVWIFLQ